MWVLELELQASSTLRPMRYGLVPGKTYIVGRAAEAHIRGQSDTSMSKNHAKIVVMSREGLSRPEVLVDDLGSKFGTHLNEGILSMEEQIQKGVDKPIRALTKTVALKQNDLIRFGVMFSVFRLKWEILNVTTSMMKDKTGLLETLQQIQPGAKISATLSKSTTHLAMSAISLSMKVVNALSLAIPLVLPTYFRDYLSSLESQQALPHPAHYIPKVTNTESESQLRDPNIDFGINQLRGEIFHGKVFVFENVKQKSANEDAVLNAGGKAVLADGKSVTEETLNENFVLIQPPSTASVNSQHNKEFVKLVAACEARGWQTSLQNHIYLAVVHCSVATFCNPNRANATKAFPVKTPTPLKLVHKERAPETLDLTAGDTLVTEDFMSGTTKVLETPASGSKPSSSTNTSAAGSKSSSSTSTSLETSASRSKHSSSTSTSGLSSNIVSVPETPSLPSKSKLAKDVFKTPKPVTDTVIMDQDEDEEFQATVSTKQPKNVKRWDDSVPKKRGRESDEEESVPKKTQKMDVVDAAPAKVSKLHVPEVPSQDKSAKNTTGGFWSDDDDDETLSQVAKIVEKSQKENRNTNTVAAFNDSSDTDLFEFTCPSKPVTKANNASQKVDSPKKDSQKNDTKKVNKGSSKVTNQVEEDDDEDIFGFDALATASKKKNNTQCQSQVTTPTDSCSNKMKHSLKMSENDDDDELFGFVAAKKTQKSTKLQESKVNSKKPAFTKQDSDDLFEFQSTGRSQATKKRAIESEAADSPAKRPKLTQDTDKLTQHEDTKTQLVKVEQVVRQENERTLVGANGDGKDSNSAKQTFNTTGFVGKGNTTIKSEVKLEPEEGVSELSRSLCKMTVLGLMRPTTPKPLYVPDASKLGKPVKNFKKFRKQDVGKIDKRVVLMKYSPSKQTSGIEQWFEQNKDLSRRLEEQDEQEKQSQDFWNFNEKQNRSRLGIRGRR